MKHGINFTPRLLVRRKANRAYQVARIIGEIAREYNILISRLASNSSHTTKHYTHVTSEIINKQTTRLTWVAPS